MALLVHHWEEVIELWLQAMDKTDEEALKPLLECVCAAYIFWDDPDLSLVCCRSSHTTCEQLSRRFTVLSSTVYSNYSRVPSPSRS